VATCHSGRQLDLSVPAAGAVPESGPAGGLVIDRRPAGFSRLMPSTGVQL